jgi:hypothetical protein
VVIIADEIPAKSLERFPLNASDRLSVGLEPRIFTTGDFLNMLQLGDHFASEALSLGIPIFGAEFVKDPPIAWFTRRFY